MMASALSLNAFLKLPYGKRRQDFNRMSIKDQQTFIDMADGLELILDGYPAKPQAEVIQFPRERYVERP